MKIVIKTHTLHVLQSDQTYGSSRSWHSLVIGRSRMPVFVFNLTDLTNPLESGFVSRTLPKGHEDLGEEGSTITTMSPVLMFFLTLDHFCRSCINVRYSCVHHLQNKSAKYCTCFHRHLAYKSALVNSPGGRTHLEFSRRM